MFHREYICIWLPNWPLQRLRADDALAATSDRDTEREPSPPVVIYRDAGQHGCRVVAFCEQATEFGVTDNMPLAEASALLPYIVEEQNHAPETSANDPSPGKSPPIKNEACQGPRFELTDPQRDSQALQTLAHFCQQYTPLFGVEDAEVPESLFLDVTGCTHLFGGQQSLVELIESDFRAAGYTTRVAMAKTFGAAWAAAHHFQLPKSASSRTGVSTVAGLSFVLPPEHTQATLNGLPISSLRVHHDTVRKLAEFDVLNICQLNQLPRTSLPSRFGKEVLLRLDQALGERLEILEFEKPPEPVQEDWHSEYSTDDHRVLLKVLDDLVGRICSRLSSRHQGTNELQIWVNGNATHEKRGGVELPANHSRPLGSSGADQPVGSRPASLKQHTTARPNVFRFAVRLTEPSSNTKHLQDLIALQLERESLKKQNRYARRRGKKNVPQAFDAEFSQVAVRAQSIAVLARRPRDLFGGLLNRDNEKELQTLLDRLSNRLGAEAVVKSNIVEDPQPELAFEWTPFIAQPQSQSSPQSSSQASNPNAFTNAASAPMARPMSLYPAPIPIQVQLSSDSSKLLKFRCRQRVFDVTNSKGPERIQTGWWRTEPIERNYFQVNTQTDQLFWLFRCDTTQRWFLHGIFD
jgi:protein ImuB